MKGAFKICDQGTMNRRLAVIVNQCKPPRGSILTVEPHRATMKYTERIECLRSNISIMPRETVSTAGQRFRPVGG